jgi:hypothetical protein
MRQIRSIRREVLIIGMRTIGAGLAALALGGTLACAADEAVMTSGNVSYVSGGVGEDSLQRMAALARDYNLKLVFAAKSGNFLADVKVVIRDARGASVLETTAEGPLLLVRLPAGKYEIAATLEGKAVRQTTSLAATGQRQLVFRWDIQVD